MLQTMDFVLPALLHTRMMKLTEVSYWKVKKIVFLSDDNVELEETKGSNR
jgi:hypothetical protein